MSYMESPTTKSQYTAEDLKDYALYRKNREIEGIEQLCNDKKITSGEVEVYEHEDYREPLSISKETVIDILLSTGGDADGFKLTFNQHNDLISGIYYWADWGVYEEVRLSYDEVELVDSLYAVSEWLTSQ